MTHKDEDGPAHEIFDYVVVTPQMVSAGVYEWKNLLASGEVDHQHIVTQLYLAMEYERLGAAGQLSRFGYESGKVRDGSSCDV